MLCKSFECYWSYFIRLLNFSFLLRFLLLPPLPPLKEKISSLALLSISKLTFQKSRNYFFDESSFNLSIRSSMLSSCVMFQQINRLYFFRLYFFSSFYFFLYKTRRYAMTIIFRGFDSRYFLLWLNHRRICVASDNRWYFFLSYFNPMCEKLHSKS